MSTAATLAADGIIYIEIAMVIFMTVFFGIVLWVLLARPGRFKHDSRIPLDDQDTGQESEHGR